MLLVYCFKITAKNWHRMQISSRNCAATWPAFFTQKLNSKTAKKMSSTLVFRPDWTQKHLNFLQKEFWKKKIKLLRFLETPIQPETNNNKFIQSFHLVSTTKLYVCCIIFISNLLVKWSDKCFYFHNVVWISENQLFEVLIDGCS